MRHELAELGLPLLAVPETLGGGNLDESDVVLIIEEAGYADVPLPIAETRRGRRAHACPLRLGGAAGEVAAEAFQWLRTRHHVVSRGRAGQPTWRRPGARRARRCRSTSSTWRSIRRRADSILREPEASVAELRARSAWVTAALLNGVSRRLLDLSVDYARTREQFGVPIGSFQAVKHMLADTAAAIEAARPTAWSAARAFADGHAEQQPRGKRGEGSGSRSGRARERPRSPDPRRHRLHEGAPAARMAAVRARAREPVGRCRRTPHAARPLRRRV